MKARKRGILMALAAVMCTAGGTTTLTVESLTIDASDGNEIEVTLSGATIET